MRRLLAVLLLCLSTAPAAAQLDALREAARTGDLETVARLLDAGANPNAWPESSSPLMFAARGGHAAVVALLIQQGALVEQRDGDGERALLWAAEAGQTEVVRLLLAAGAVADSDRDPYGNTPLLKASWNGHLETARLLLDAGADPRWQSSSGWTPLYAAVLSRNADLVALLLAVGADTNPADSRALATPLHEAVLYDQPAIVRLLLDAGAAIEARDYRGQTPLYVAAQQNRTAIALLLLAAGADPEVRDAAGRTPLLAAMGFPASDAFDYGSVALLLAERSADLDRALVAALWGDLPAVAGVLLARGASPNAVDGDRSALAGAARLPGDGAVRLLLAAGADTQRFGGAALGEAVWAGRQDIALLLLQDGVAVDARDAWGATALLRAAGAGQVAMLRWLLAAGADPGAVDAQGRDAEAYMTTTTTLLVDEIENRSASRAWKPTEHLEIQMQDLDARFAEIRALLAASRE